jgi:signal peptidase complex subunit 1
LKITKDSLFKMDFKGQQLSERASQIIITLCGIVAFIVGYAQQDFGVMMKIFTGGVIVAFLGTVLDWPMFNKNPVTWRRPAGAKNGNGSRQAGSSAVASMVKLFQ